MNGVMGLICFSLSMAASSHAKIAAMNQEPVRLVVYWALSVIFGVLGILHFLGWIDPL